MSEKPDLIDVLTSLTQEFVGVSYSEALEYAKIDVRNLGAHPEPEVLIDKYAHSWTRNKADIARIKACLTNAMQPG